MLAERLTFEELKRRLDDLAPTSTALEQQRLVSGDPSLDRVLNGGLCLSKVSGWSGSPGSGMTSLLRLLVRQTLMSGYRVVLIDMDGTLYAPDWCDMPHIGALWRVQPQSPEEGVWATEHLANSGAVGLVVLSCIEQRPLPARVASRFRAAAKRGNTAILILAAPSAQHLNAALEVHVESVETALAQGRQTVRATRTRGGPPESAEVSFDIRQRITPERMPQAALVADRRGLSRTRGRSSEGIGLDPRAGGASDGSLPLS